MNDDMLHRSVSSVPSSRLTCSQCERMVQDAMDGTLLAEDRVQFDLHIAGCPGCSRIYEDAAEGLLYLKDLKLVAPEPPSLLLPRILAETSGNPQVAIPVRRGEPILAAPGADAVRDGYPAGHLATVLPFRQPVRRSWPARWMHGISQPRFAMTAAMAFFSIALTMNLLGVSPGDFHVSSLAPSHLRHTFWGTRNRVVQYYDNLRIVYELESRVNEIRQSDEDQSTKREPDRKPPEKAAPGGNGSHSRLRPPRRRASLRPSALIVPVPSLLPAASAAGNRGEGASV